MKKKELVIIGCLLTMIFMTAIMIHNICERPSGRQREVESLLPFGEYLPTSENPKIRVVLMTNGFQGIAHPEVEVSAKEGLRVNGEQKGTTIVLQPDSEYFEQGSVVIETNRLDERITISSMRRGYGTPSYRGKLELYTTAEGIVIVNEVPLEEYLYAVVPSEMPASYDMEALKCQAVCARSYAYCQMMQFSYPAYEAHVDDSVSFQVYGNSEEKETTTKAVKETEGKKLWYQGKVVKTYYYSTSSGHSTDVRAWGSKVTEETKYLKGVPICDENGTAYDKNYPWYRWKIRISEEILRQMVENNSGKTIGEIQNVEITKRGAGNVALQLVVTGTKEKITIETENKIRSLFKGGEYTIEKQDGSMVKSTKLLPSAFFTIAKSEEHYIIEGGGYGHGIGMSQNGANEMAKTGMNYKDILQFFYSGAKVE